MRPGGPDRPERLAGGRLPSHTCSLEPDGHARPSDRPRELAAECYISRFETACANSTQAEVSMQTAVTPGMAEPTAHPDLPTIWPWSTLDHPEALLQRGQEAMERRDHRTAAHLF